MNRPSIDSMMMQTAELMSLRATCSRLQVGAVIADASGRIISSGWNGSPAGKDHCWDKHDCDCVPINNWHPRTCNSQQPCTYSDHAERNAMFYALGSTWGSSLFLTNSPCEDCADMVIYYKLKRVVYRDLYRVNYHLRKLTDAGILVEQYKP